MRNEDFTGFEQRERRIARPIRIDDRRNLVVRVDRQEILTELLVLRDVDRVNLVGDAEFLQQDRDFLAVRCAPGIVLDGHWAGSRSEEHTSALQSLLRISYAVFRLTT